MASHTFAFGTAAGGWRRAASSCRLKHRAPIEVARSRATVRRRTMSKAAFALAATMLVLTAGSAAGAEEIRVLSPVAMRAAMPEIVAQFETSAGVKLKVEYATAGAIADRLQKGDAWRCRNRIDRPDRHAARRGQDHSRHPHPVCPGRHRGFCAHQRDSARPDLGRRIQACVVGRPGGGLRRSRQRRGERNHHGGPCRQTRHSRRPEGQNRASTRTARRCFPRWLPAT